MSTLNILVPVFLLLGLGYLSRVKQWVSLEQKNGATSIVFGIFFPILIFHLIATAQFELSTLSMIGYVTVMYLIALVVGKLLIPFTGKERAHFSSYLLTTVEGGSVALPLYLSIVGTSSLTVMFDLAGSILAFLVIPVLVARQSFQATSTKNLIKGVVTHPFVLAILFGLLANLVKLPALLEQVGLAQMYTGIMGYIGGPIGSIILFGLGYDLHFQKETLASVVRLALVRVGFYVLIIAGFFVLFPTFMADPLNKLGVILYFMCPAGFALPAIFAPVFKNEEDASFSSTFISLYMVISLTVYALLVIFMAP